ncbi:MAG: guanylate kinase [Coriobacteriia bacterium]|nr:guanylate kinase [Coriobacteriia bacterium]
MTREGHLFIISGPSGAGKGTLVKELLRRVPDLWVSVSATTRTPRPGERDTVDYFFLTPTEFEGRVRAGEFLEHAEVHGNRYGTLRRPVERRNAAGMDVILEIDPQGAFQVRKQMDGSRLIFVKAPSTEELEKRIRSRGAESDDQIRTRLETARRELELEGTYDHVVLNDDVSRATDDLVAYIRSVSEQA